MKDYYDILGIKKDADKTEIKKAFRKLAQKYHPDKADGDEKKFKEANEAYTVLSDEKKRQQYDTYGHAGAQAGFGGAGAGAQGFDFSGFDFSGFQGGAGQGGFSAGGFNFDDIFSGFGGVGHRQRVGEDIAVNLKISFKESVFGAEKTFYVKKDVSCKDCSGTGAEGQKLKTCPDCNGSGYIVKEQRTIFGITSVQQACTTCFGDGKIPEKNCKTCSGKGIVHQKEEINVKIPAGVEKGSRLRIRQKGNAIQGGENGDLYIYLEVEADKRFEKLGYDLSTELEISITDAVLGAVKEVETIDGKVKIKIPLGTSDGAILKVKNEGVVKPDKSRGVLYLKIKINIPQKLNREQKKLFEELKNTGI